MRKILAIQLVVAALLLYVLSTVEADACTFKSKFLYKSKDSIKQCIEQIPFRETVRKQVMDSVKKLYPSYVFADIIRDRYA